MNQFHVPMNLPPKSYRQKIEKMSEQIHDPVRKLRFLNKALADYQRVNGHEIGGLENISNDPAALRIVAETKAASREVTGPKTGNRQDIRSVGSIGRVSAVRAARTVLLFGFFIILVGAFVTALKFSHDGLQSNITEPAQANTDGDTYHPISASRDAEPMRAGQVLAMHPVNQRDAGKPASPGYPEYLDTTIWMVEKTADSEFYSNGLRIYTAQSTDNVPRAYYRVILNEKGEPVIDRGAPTSAIAGILYHASESDVYEFSPEMSQNIREYSRLLSRYLRKRKAYHYFIDRFGQVFRLVREDQAAFHAGNSIWVDADIAYIDLNQAFIGICFEGRDFVSVDPEVDLSGEGTTPHIAPMPKSSITEAQLISGKELTDWLRVKYGIAQHNCVPHGLASVNPYDMLIGHHLDLSFGFPFDLYGLNDKYNESIPAMTTFGFSYNNYFVEILKDKIWPGIDVSENQLQHRAEAENMTKADLRNRLKAGFVQLFKDYKNLKTELTEKQLAGR